MHFAKFLSRGSGCFSLGAPDRLWARPGGAVESASVKSLFKNPPREYSTGPLWVWNDLLTEQQIRDTLRDLADQKVKQVWVHPRPGLMTPYLSRRLVPALEGRARTKPSAWT